MQQTQSRYGTTEEVILGMLKEDTGTNLLDSGSVYGRNYETNRHVATLDGFPVVTASFSVSDGALHVDPTVYLGPWMRAHLEFDPELQAEIDEYADDHANLSWFDIAGGAANQASRTRLQAQNTYSCPADFGQLSQDFLFHPVDRDRPGEISHLIVMVHGGCDIRGGYTRPKAFKLLTEFDDAVDNARVKDVFAQDNVWYWNGSFYESARLDVSNLSMIPAFDLDEVTSAEIGDADAALLQASKDRLVVQDPEKIALAWEARVRALRYIDLSLSALAERCEVMRLEHLAQDHDEFIVVHERQAWYFNSDSDLELKPGQDLTVGVGF